METDKSQPSFACDICFDNFSSALKCPRMLTCGHTFCHECISKFIYNKSVCPVCNKEIVQTDAKDVPINYYLVSQLKEDNTYEEEIDDADLEHEGICSKHTCPNHFVCLKCECLICGTCLALKHKNCKTLKLKEGLNQLKSRKFDQLEARIKKLTNDNIKRTDFIAKNGRKMEIEKKKREKSIVLLEELKKIQYNLVTCEKFEEFTEAEKDIQVLTNSLQSFNLEGREEQVSNFLFTNYYSLF